MSSRLACAALLAASCAAAESMNAAAVSASLPVLQVPARSAGTVAQVPERGSDTTSAVARKDAIGARIDSLAAEHRKLLRLLHERDSLRAARAAELRVARAAGLRTDTVVIGPFLFINQAPPPAAAVAALESAWEAHAAAVGPAIERLNGTVISRDLDASQITQPAMPVRPIRFAPRSVGGRPDYGAAAERAVVAALQAALPEDVLEWLGGADPGHPDPFVWAYRDLVTSGLEPVRRCYSGYMNACGLALIGDAAPLMTPLARVSLLQLAFELGGAGSYSRLLDPAPDVATRLANAAGRPAGELIVTWRSEVQEARPRVHAGVARAGFWTFMWLLGLATFAMRSTRWRL